MQDSQFKTKSKEQKPSQVNSPSEKHRINEEITVPEVRLIAADGEQLGVLSTRDALRMADDVGLDLVEVAPQAVPPVCRLLDYGKLKYREQKRNAEARKKGATKVVKELRVRYSTDDHDLDTKIRAARRFIEEGDKVRFSMRFRGREVIYKDLADTIFEQVIEKLKDIAEVEERTPLLGMRMILALGPKNE